MADEIIDDVTTDIDPNVSHETQVNDPPATETGANTAPNVTPPRVSFLDTIDDQWRSDVLAKLKLEGDDAKKMEKYMAKYNSIDQLTKAGYEANLKISRGEITSGKPVDDNAEAMKAWREERGIPHDADSYNDVIKDAGYDEVSNEILKSMFPIAHKYDLSQEAVKEISASLLSGREARIEALNASIRAKDANYDSQVSSILQEAWGNNKDSNMEAARQFINKLPEGLRDSITEFRDSEGKGLIHYPELWIALSDAERKINPMGTVVGTSDNAVKTAQAEYDALTARMSEPGWHKDKAANDRWEQLHEALTRQKAN